MNAKKKILSNEDKLLNIIVDFLINALCFIGIILEYITENYKLSVIIAIIIIMIIYNLEKRFTTIVQLLLMVLFIFYKFKIFNSTYDTFVESSKILLIQSALAEGLWSVCILGKFYYYLFSKHQKKKKINNKINKATILESKIKFL